MAHYVHLGLRQRLDGCLVFQDVPFGRGEDVQDLVLNLFQRALVFCPHEDKFILLIFQVGPFVFHYYAKQLFGQSREGKHSSAAVARLLREGPALGLSQLSDP